MREREELPSGGEFACCNSSATAIMRSKEIADYASQPLKRKLQSELDHPIITRQQSAVSADVLSDAPEIRRVQVDTTR